MPPVDESDEPTTKFESVSPGTPIREGRLFETLILRAASVILSPLHDVSRTLRRHFSRHPPYNEKSISSLKLMITMPSTERTSFHELAEAASRRLKNSSYRRIRGLTCECDERGVLYLRGRLPSYYQKQLAQEAVAGLPGVVGIVNKVEVVDGDFSTAAPV